MTTREVLLWALAAVSVMWALVGCAARPCYEIVVMPSRRVAIISDLCRGDVYYQPIPRLPDEPQPQVTPHDPKAKIPL